MNFQHIMLVCVGNICRSPMAEILLDKALQGRHIKVNSAGISALHGHTADPMAITLMQERALDLSAHRAQQLTPELARGADLLLTMESGHIDAVLRIAPAMRGRVFSLGHWNDKEVPDPYRQPRAAFELALQHIDVCLPAWLDRI